MHRDLLSELTEWHNGTARKPLLVRGARQVGKTWIVRELARVLGKDLIELNFEHKPEAGEALVSAPPERIIETLELLVGRRIAPEGALLFLDEIQRVPKTYSSLRWFYEHHPELPVVATGSLMDFVLSRYEYSVPVGRVSYMYMEPMTFKEFLVALGKQRLASFITEYEPAASIPPPIHDMMMSLLQRYMIVGGMPAAVQRWVDTSSPLAVAEEQQSLVATLSDDFSKYATRQPPDRMRKVMLSIPRMLGKKYRYSEVDRDERSNALAKALSLLSGARICHKVIHSAGHGVPLASEQNPRRFKVIFMDTGLASAIMGLAPVIESELTDLSRTDRGGMGEQLTGQLLRASEHWFMDPTLHYHVREKSGSQAEIDYLIQHGGRIIPIEVKAGATGRLKSLHQFMADRQFPLAFRVNSSPPVTSDIDVKTQKGDRARYRLVSIPPYLASEIRRLCDA